MSLEKASVLNVAEANKQLSNLLVRVAGGETILITRRGRPVAKLVPPDSGKGEDHPANVSGWLEEDDLFFSIMDEIEADRAKHTSWIQTDPNSTS